MTIPHITIEQAKAAVGISLAEGWLQSLNRLIDSTNAHQESEYITAEQARGLGAGNAEWKTTTSVEGWNLCSPRCEYLEFSWTHNAPCIYRATKQAQPEPTETEEESNASWAAVDAPIPPAVVHHAADEGALK